MNKASSAKHLAEGGRFTPYKHTVFPMNALCQSGNSAQSQKKVLDRKSAFSDIMPSLMHGDCIRWLPAVGSLKNKGQSVAGHCGCASCS